MSIFTNIAAAAHTFVGWFEKELAKFQADAPAIETFIANGVKYSTSILKIVLSQVDAGSPAAKILSTAIQDLLTVAAVSYDAGAHPSLGSDFQAIVSNLGALEAAAGIKNANSLGIVQKVISTISAIVAVLVPA